MTARVPRFPIAPGGAPRLLCAARGPTPARRRSPGPSMAEKARTAWGADLPDWVEELAAIADVRGLKGAAVAIGYSPSTVSTVISRTYGAAGMEPIEQKVRGALMGLTVDCPILGEIGRHDCLDHQKRPFAATNAIRTRLYHACRGGCPHARIAKE